MEKTSLEGQIQETEKVLKEARENRRVFRASVLVIFICTQLVRLLTKISRHSIAAFHGGTERGERGEPATGTQRGRPRSRHPEDHTEEP